MVKVKEKVNANYFINKRVVGSGAYLDDSSPSPIISSSLCISPDDLEVHCDLYFTGMAPSEDVDNEKGVHSQPVSCQHVEDVVSYGGKNRNCEKLKGKRLRSIAICACFTGFAFGLALFFISDRVFKDTASDTNVLKSPESEPDLDLPNAFKRNGEVCEESSECLEKESVCAFAQNHTICCSKGVNIRNTLYCADQEDGSDCNDDKICKSLFCYHGVCSEELHSGELCEFGTDCRGGECAYEEFQQNANKVCCNSYDDPDNRPSIMIDDVKYCTNLSARNICGSNEMCISKACAYSYPQRENKQCCEAYTLSTRFKGKEYCADKSVDEPCATDEMCIESLVCLDGLCSKPLLESGSHCTSHDECAGSLCAHNFGNISETVCCSNERSVEALYQQGQTLIFCQSHENEPCATNEMCIDSLVCLNGFCSNTLLESGLSCTSHDECRTNLCAEQFFGDYSETLCCSSNNSVEAEFEQGQAAVFCANQESGYPCLSDNMCASGRCALRNFTISGDYICCDGDYEEIDSFQNPNSSTFVCTNQHLDMPCGTDSMCSSGFCNLGQCKNKSASLVYVQFTCSIFYHNYCLLMS